MAAKSFTSSATARANGSSTRHPIKARGSGRTRSFDHYLHRHEVAARWRRPHVRPPGGLTTTIPVVDENSLRLEHVVSPFVDRRRTVYERLVKPVLDRVGAALLLAVFGPLLALIALAVWVTLGSPIMLTQERIGQHGRTFGMFKFRTMRPDRRNGQRSDYRGPERRRTHKSADDPRHTWLGRRLRKTSLDELPQLLNVLRGEMSLVGPRPELAEIAAQYRGWQHARHVVKPGITGLWQVTERPNGALMHECTEIDLAYVQRLSLRADLAIMLKTPLAVLCKERVV
jgi:lipopolysaccharide/colanic/teichoic acid biosynthesis glycosyltransferase